MPGCDAEPGKRICADCPDDECVERDVPLRVAKGPDPITGGYDLNRKDLVEIALKQLADKATWTEERHGTWSVNPTPGVKPWVEAQKALDAYRRTLADERERVLEAVKRELSKEKDIRPGTMCVPCLVAYSEAVRSLRGGGEKGEGQLEPGALESAWCKWKKGDCEYGAGKCVDSCGYLCGGAKEEGT